ncbi:MAG TPA: hypothetical protein ENK28_12330 [Aliiroseovarius sp.]|nr:hypothetical protein [Aliiroseovarius sp.]
MSLIKKLGVASFAVIMSVGGASALTIGDASMQGDNSVVMLDKTLQSVTNLKAQRAGSSLIEEVLGGFMNSDERGHRGGNVAEMMDSYEGEYAKGVMAYERCKVRNPDDYMTNCEYWGEIPALY